MTRSACAARTLIAAAALAGSAALVAACGSSGGTAASPPASATATATPSASPSGPASTSPPAAAATPSGPQPCPTSALRASVPTGQGNAAAGSSYYPIDFTNVSGTSCTLFGYPGASFVTGIGGSQVGGAAIRNPTFAAQVVTLAPGATAHASLQVVVAQNYPASLCLPVTAHWLRVYPPNQFVPLYVSFTAVTCTGKIPGGSTLGIYVVRPGTTGP